jgi:hypothetical protein
LAKPQPTDAHLRIAHSILEQIMVSDFSKRQLSILLFILRLSWGCGKKEAVIPRQNDFSLVGVSSGHIKAELDWLEESKVIYRNGNFYGFNKNYDDWRISRAKEYREGDFTKMVSLNLRKIYRNGKDDLPKRETKVPETVKPSSRNGKEPTPKPASAKERGGEEGGNSPSSPKEKDRNDDNNASSSQSSSQSSSTLERARDIFKLFEWGVGKLTPIIREELRALQAMYPPGWVREAIQKAALAGPDKQNCLYIAGILRNWAREGRKEPVAVKPVEMPPEPDPAAIEIWSKASEELAGQVTRSFYRTWLGESTGMSYKGNQFVVGVPNAFIAEYLNQNQRSLIEKTLIGLTRPGIEIAFGVLQGGTSAKQEQQKSKSTGG